MPTKDYTLSRIRSQTRSFPVVIVLFLALVGVSNAQVSIKERVEIKPTNIARLPLAVDPLDVTLPPINLADFSLDACGGFILPFDNIYDDQIFIPRVGGTMGLAFDPFATHTGYMVGPYGCDLFSDTLLVFGMDGHIEYYFPLRDSYGFDQELYIRDSLGCSSCDPTLWGYYPKVEMLIHVNAWEPLRFRYYVHRPFGGNTWYTWPVHSSRLLKPTVDFYDLPTSYPDSYGWDLSTDLPPYEYTGRIAFAWEDFHPDTATSAEGIGMVFPMRWVSIDSNAIGAPPSRETSDPIVLPDSGMYRIIVGYANSPGSLSLSLPKQQVLFPNVQDAIGDTIVAGPYGEGTPLQVVLNGQSPCVMQTDYAKWNMGYETGNDYYFDDVGITVEYAVQPPDHLELWSTTETVYYGDTVDVDIVPCGSDSLFSPLGRDEDYQFSIELTDETSRYGQLLYQGESGNNFWGIPSVERRGTGVQFAANGVEPDSSVDLTFYLTAEFIGGGGGGCKVGGNPDTSQRYKIPIVMKSMSKQNIAPGINGKQISLAAKRPLKKMSKAFMADKGNEEMSKIVVQSKASKKQDTKQQGTSLFKWMMHEKKLGKFLAANKSNKKSGLKPLTKVSASISAKNNTTSVNYLENYWTTKEKEHDILLGETIYYQVREKMFESGGKKLVIEERGNSTYSDDGVIKSDAVWGDNPVSKANGDKLGVYWEKKDSNGNKLPDGLIRLIGRYWTSETAYKVGLTANYDEISEYAEIVVKKPTSLGDAHQTAYDVHGSSYALDDSIIAYAGKEGVCPQYIKGMTQKETNFKPSYRYEPFLDLRKVHKKDRHGNYAFEPRTSYWINDNAHMGNPGIPTDHSNLYDGLGNKTSYPTTCQSIWDIYQADMSNPKSLYSDSVYGNTYGMQDQWTYFYNDTSGMPIGYTSAQASDSANSRFMRWMRDIWCGGMKGSIAQTRISASYGLIQLVYYYAVDSSEYPMDSSHRPEDINLVPYALRYGILHFENELKTATKGGFADNEWQEGLEKCYAKALGINNGAPDYVPDVVQYTGQYLPK